MNKSELIYQVREVLGNPPTNEYSDSRILKQLNIYYQQATEYAISANGIWEVNWEVATTDIKAGQKEYVLTTDTPLLALKKVEANLTWNINEWEKCNTLDLRSTDYAISNTTTDYGDFTIDLYGNSIFFYNTPAVNVINGLKIFYQKQAIELRDNDYTVTLEEDLIDSLDPTLGYKTITINGLRANLSVNMIQNNTDTLAITLVGDLLTIKLANTTASKNTDALIQVGIRALTGLNNAIVSVNGWTNILGNVINKGSQIVEVLTYDTPNLPDVCQMYLVYGAAYTYAIGHKPEKVSELRTLIQIEKDRIVSHYANRAKVERTQRKWRIEQYN